MSSTTYQDCANQAFLTNNYSIVSKYSATKCGYFKDQILESFIVQWPDASKTWRRAPLINRGYAARMMATDWKVNRSLQFNSIDCAIVLGAGFDTLALRCLGQCTWIEIDLPEVIATKRKFIIEQWKLNDACAIKHIGGGPNASIKFNSLGLYLIPCDIRNTDDLFNKLSQTLKHLEKHPRNLAIINEVCLCYLEPREVKEALETVIESMKSDSLLRVHYIGYEQVMPNEHSPEFSQIMLEHFKSHGHPLKYFPTRSQLKDLLVGDLKFSHVTIASMYQIFHNALQTTKMQTDAFEIEPFDEFEEMDLYLSHYALVTGLLLVQDPFISSEQVTLDEACEDLSKSVCSMGIDNRISHEASLIRRYGHYSCVLSDSSAGQLILVGGGFGLQDLSEGQQHKRLVDCTVISRDACGHNETINLPLSNPFSEPIRMDRMHGQVSRVGENLLLFSGGRQNPQDKPRACNVPFIAKIESNQLVVEHVFAFDDQIQACSMWRHKTRPIRYDKIVQVGGINNSATSRPLVIWNLSSSKLGPDTLATNSEHLSKLDRHSFGLDMRDEYTMLIYGGLQTAIKFRDSPIDNEYSALLWDLRSDQPVSLARSAGCYGSNVHFISDNQFVKIGGVSTLTGLAENFIDLLDLRMDFSSPVQRESVPTEENEELMVLVNTTTCKLNNPSQIVTVGGGGNFFTFGTSFNRTHLVYKYA